jgi:hypothetical protein
MAKRKNETPKVIHPNSLENLKSNYFPPNKSGNPNGRPPSLVKAILKEFNEGDGDNKPLTKKDIYDTLFALTLKSEKEIEALCKSNDIPVFIKILCGGLKGKNKYYILRDTFDRIFGKPSNTSILAEDADNPLSSPIIQILSVTSGLPPLHDHIDPNRSE